VEKEFETFYDFPAIHTLLSGVFFNRREEKNLENVKEKQVVDFVEEKTRKIVN